MNERYFCVVSRIVNDVERENVRISHMTWSVSLTRKKNDTTRILRKKRNSDKNALEHTGTEDEERRFRIATERERTSATCSCSSMFGFTRFGHGAVVSIENEKCFNETKPHVSIQTI